MVSITESPTGRTRTKAFPAGGATTETGTRRAASDTGDGGVVECTAQKTRHHPAAAGLAAGNHAIGRLQLGERLAHPRSSL